MAISVCEVQTNPQGRELGKHGTAAFPVACYYDNLATNDVPWHWHDEMEVCVVTQGETIFATDTEQFTACAGEGVFINAGVLHAMRCVEPGESRFRSLVFHPRLVGGDEGSVFYHDYLTPLMTNTAQRIVLLRPVAEWNWEALAAIEDAWKSCAREEAGYEFRVREALSRLLLLLRGHRPAEQARPSVKALRDGARIKAMLEFVRTHYAEELHAAEIAGSALIGEGECLRCFRSTIGMTPMQYVKQFRIRKAAELLTATDGRVAEIAVQCGFQEMSYFSKAFREAYGCTPSEYRKRQRGTSLS